MSQRVNLSNATVLVFERSVAASKIITQMLRGFGVGRIVDVETVDAARDYVSREAVDLIVADPAAANGDGMEFLRWLRRAKLNPNRFTPILLVAGHTKDALVKLARDAGANFIVAKPLAPKTMLERILWLSRDMRTFVDAGAYVGPDRRLKQGPLPAGQRDRRGDHPAIPNETEGEP